MAEGTAQNPIIFTYEGDNGGSSATLRGQWGGLIILGKARLNSTPGESAIGEVDGPAAAAAIDEKYDFIFDRVHRSETDAESVKIPC